ncbi:MAG: Lrp/AsnC ligand binding domain-containing protein [Candidatus Brockarchaeota archaeon]|nr:Lrp/AsnC ligand binding domain-containing protein [Candidatus Brockarchaeota archaeon]
MTIVLLETENAEAMRKFLQSLRTAPRVVKISSIPGDYNLITLVLAENLKS